MRIHPGINIFNTGEVTPLMYHRRDFKKFPSSCAVMENCIPLIYGPFMKRSGTKYVAGAKSDTTDALLIPFVFSETQSYIIELGHYYVRFYTNEGQVVKTLATTDAWVTGTNYINGYSYVKESGTIYRCAETHTSGTFADDLAAGKWTEQSIYEIPSPYAAANLTDLDFEQNNDILFITYSGYRPMKLSRYNHTKWVMEEVAFKDGPYMPENTNDSYKLAASAATGNITIQATGHGPFTSSDVGRHVWISDGGSPPTIGWAKITAYNDSGNVDATVQRTMPIGNQTKWRLGHYSDGRGWPYTNGFHSGRHYYGGTDSDPGRVDGSVPDDYETFSPVDQVTGDQTDASAIQAPISTGKSNIIKWLLSMETLFVGTLGNEVAFEAEGGDTAFTPTNYVVKEISQHGSKKLKPIKLNNTGIFLQKAGRKLREITYSFTDDKYIFPDLSVFAEHLTYGGIKQIAYQEEPISMFWIVKENGELVSFAYDKRQEVIAWGRHQLGGNFVKVLSAAAIPHPTENRDRVWLLVERYIDGGLKRYVEYFESEFDTNTDQEDGYFVDCGATRDVTQDIEDIEWDAINSVTNITITGHGLSTGDTVIFRDILTYVGTDYSELNGNSYEITKVNNDTFSIEVDSSSYTEYNTNQNGTISSFISEITSGLDHLEGETVDVVVDGVPQTQKTVTNGEVELDSAGATIHIGLPFSAYWKSLRMMKDMGDGSHSGARHQKIHAIDIDIYKTSYAKYGTEINGVEELVELPIGNSNYALSTKKVTTDFGGRWGKEPQVIIKSDKPTPLCIQEVTPLVSVN